MQYIGYLGATVINVVLMLNLLISILGDSYEVFQLERAIVDIKEKARISMELQSIMFWSSKVSLLKCIRLCNTAFQDEEKQDWEGRILFMNKRLDKSIGELTENNKIAETKAADRSISMEGKIMSVEGKITSVEGKMDDLNKKFKIILNIISK